MRRGPCAFALVAALLACAPGAHGPDRIERGDALRGVPAGVVPYACVDGAARVLLAFDPEPERAGWGHFGGTPKPGETAADTAARELHEETNCAFPGPAAAELAALPASRSGAFYSFCVELPYRPPAEIARPRADCPDVERSRWVWVRHADLLAALAGDAARPTVETVAPGGTAPGTIDLWPGATASLRRALADGVLPRADPCRE